MQPHVVRMVFLVLCLSMLTLQNGCSNSGSGQADAPVSNANAVSLALSTTSGSTARGWSRFTSGGAAGPPGNPIRAGVASAEYQVDKQIADIENTIQQHPDGIISIPVDFTATAPTYKKVSQAGIKLVFMDSIRWA